ncbi:CDP-glycerol glycerophosphotransferase family protein [Bacillus cereus]|uniref:CDP-glycerol glycerophosphotransferase family protein n=1 Tax=Bacillus cereus TaxID=1396 RepID=UPI000BFB1CE6|nr:CDP-glycerol glycerophosphotransferase family protein [Bacillus cereus]PGY13293.1 teichoic acid biosynthesis protein TagF [Bacillus cereus]WJE28010.1 CDP-glycerol glycerophosphotransferase family protein [Bacillus cereus]
MLRKIYYLIKSIPIILIDRWIKKDYKTIIFSSSYNNNYDYNSKYLFEYILKNHSEYNCKFVINDDKKRIKLIEEIGDHFIETKSFRGMYEVIQSGCWVISAGLPLNAPGIGKNRVIHNVWHGIPLKRIGLMQNNLSNLTRIYFKSIFSKNYTSIVTNSKFLVPIMSKSFGVDESRVKILGQPRNDLIEKENNSKEILTNIEGEVPDYQKLVIYAPTFRDDAPTKIFPFEDYDIEELNAFLEDNKIIMFIRMHKYEGVDLDFLSLDRIRILDNEKAEDVMEIINIFDLLITDYSSIYIDYLLLERPIIFLPYDIEQYEKNRGFNFNYHHYTPGPKPRRQDEFLLEMRKLLNDSNYFSGERKDINNQLNEVTSENSRKNFNFIEKEIAEKLSIR